MSRPKGSKNKPKQRLSPRQIIVRPEQVISIPQPKPRGRPKGSRNGTTARQSEVVLDTPDTTDSGRGFRIVVDVKNGHRQYELEFGVERKHSSLLTLPVRDSEESFVIRPDEGRKFGDGDLESGTPCTVAVGKFKAPAAYFDYGGYAMIQNRIEV